MRNGLRNLSAGLVTLAIIAGLAGYLWAYLKANALHGPTHIAVHGQTVVVADGQSLSWLNAESGQLNRRIRLDALNVSAPLMDLQLLPDGTLLIGETSTQLLRRCIETSCDTLADLSWLAGRFFKFHFDPDSERLYVAETHDNRLWVLDPPYEKHDIRIYCEQLSSPNEIWRSPEGRLWVADTDHRRVIELEDAEPVAVETGRVLSGRTERSDKSYPLDFAGNGTGPWWVLLTGPSYLNGEILEYANDGTPTRTIRLPRGSDPIAVEDLGDGALISDMGGFALYRVDQNGQISRFGDQAYYDALGSLKHEHEGYNRIRNSSLVVLAIGIVSAILIVMATYRVGTLARSRQPALDTSTDLVAVDGIYWLEPDPKLLRQLRTLAMALIILSVVLVPLVYLTGNWFFDSGRYLLLLSLLGASVGVWMLTVGPRLFPLLGSDGEVIYLRDLRRFKESAYRPSNILISNRMLKLDDRLVALRNGHGRHIYRDSDISRHIRPLIPDSGIVGEGRMLLEALRMGHIPTWGSVLILVAAVIWLLYP